MKDGARSAASGPSLHFGALLVLSSLALLGILALLNILSYRFYGRWDLSQDALFALSPQTRQALDGLKRPVQVTAFFYSTQGTWEQEARYRLEAYRAYNNRISFQIVDPELRPALAEAYGFGGGSYALAVECGDRRTLIYSFDEQALTSAILQVALLRPVTVYLYSEHGEIDLADSAPEGYSTARGLLEMAGYRIVARPFAADGSTLAVSDSVAVLLGPQTALAVEQEQRLLNYLDRGGRLLLLLDPTSPDLGALLRSYGVVAEKLTVVDPQYGLGGKAEVPVIYIVNPNHPISRNLPAAVFSAARPLNPSGVYDPGLRPSPLLITSPGAWGEANPEQQPPTFDSGQDWQSQQGLALAVAVEGRLAEAGPGPAMRLVVVGDSDFARNEYIALGGNAQLFLSAVNWLAEKDMPAVEIPERRVVMTSLQVHVTRYVTLFGLPLAIIAAGVVVWWRRRKGQSR